MSCALVEDLGPPEVQPGTMLRVQEGQDCAVLCAADEEPGAIPSGGTPGSCRTWLRQSGSPRSPHAQQQPQRHQQRNTGISATAGAAAGSNSHSGGGAAAAAAASTGNGDDDDITAATAVLCLDDDEGCYEGDGATATAGDGSSTLRGADGDDDTDDDTQTSFSELSDPGGTEVVFVREGVAVWPGARSERILGRLSLVKQCGVLFMAWLPYSRGVLQPDGTFRVVAADTAAAPPPLTTATVSRRELGHAGEEEDAGAVGPAAAAGSDRTLYAVHPIPLSEVRALRRRTPPLGLGAPQLLVVLGSGVTLPPLHFTRGGVKALIATLKQHVFLLKSASEPHTYLVNDTADPLCRSLSALQLADVLIGGPPPGASATFEPGGAAMSVTSAAAAVTTTTAPYGRNAVPPPPASRPAAASWATPASGLGLAAAAGMGSGGGGHVAGGGGGGGSNGGGARDAGTCQHGVTWSWADRPMESGDAASPTTAAAAAEIGGFETVDGNCGGGDGAAGGGRDDREEDEDDGGSSSGYRGAGATGAFWASSIVDAINRFVQNVRGTASGWIGALDELDDTEADLLYGNGSSYQLNCTDDDVDEDGDNGNNAARDNAEPQAAQPCVTRTPYSAVGGGAGAGIELQVQHRHLSIHISGEKSNSRGMNGITPCASNGAADAANGDAQDSSAATAAAAAAAAASPKPGGSGGDVAGDVSTAVGDFELLDGGGCWGEASAHPLLSRRRLRPPPLSAEEWAAMFDADGRLVAEAALRDRVCASGCCPELRREVWKHLLGMYPRGGTAAQRRQVAQAWQRDYLTLRSQWQSMSAAQEARCAAWRAARTAVDKDVRRTDRTHPFFARDGGPGLRALRHVLLTHAMYDQDLGYCQGMSDLAAPLLVVMRDEAEAFWALTALLEARGLRGNFHTDMAGMNSQLAALRRLVQLLDPPLHAYLERRDCLSYYFAFRWLLIHFKREFKFDEVLSLWEACWACRRTRHLHLYLAAAVLVRHRRVILSSDLDFDGMLRLCIGLSGRLELQPLLETAEALAGYAGEAGREATQGLP